MKPNFLIIGAGKCGTTSLAYYLNQHPDVYMSEPKEPWFFDGEEYEKGLDFYWNKYFKGWNGQKAVGEASSQNLYVPFVAQRLKEALPEAKLIAILRNPVDRAFSHWWMNFCAGLEKLSFEEAIYKDLERIKTGITFEGKEGKRLWYEYISWYRRGRLRFRLYLDYGYYAQQIKRYLKLFPESQIKIVFLEDLSRNPQAVVSELWRFIGVDPNYKLKDPTPQNIANTKALAKISALARATKLNKIIPKQGKIILRRWLSNFGKRPEMSKSMRLWLIDHYYQHNRELERLVGRDLSHWDR